LPDGGIITIGANNFQANYEGGDGNDLTLTVVHSARPWLVGWRARWMTRRPRYARHAWRIPTPATGEKHF